MADFQNTIDLLGDAFTTIKIIDRTLEEYNDDSLSSLGPYAFGDHWLYHNPLIPLTSVNLPKVTSIGEGAFYECKSLVSANLPNATTIGRDAFLNCTKLANLNVPNIVRLDASSVFSGCSSLVSLDFYVLNYLNSNRCFSYNFATLIIRTASVCSLGTTIAFDGSGFASGYAGGKLLVPRDLVESYKTTTNWSVIWGYGHNRFLALEDYTVDGTITGEIDWDKLNGGTTA